MKEMFDPEHIVQAGGLIIIALIIFVEGSLLIGIILPGNSLLLAAGLFAAQDKLPITWLIVSIIVATIIGYGAGYNIGKKLGPQLFKRKDGFLFREEYITKTKQFFNKYGQLTVVGARFFTHVRTLVPTVAGASRMDSREYFVYSVIGAILWGSSLPLLGYFLGSRVPNFDKYLVMWIVGVIIILYSFTAWQLLNNPERRKNLKTGLKEDWDYFFGSKK